MELFEIKTASAIVEKPDYRSAKEYFDRLDCPAELYVIREPGGDADLLDSKPRVIRRELYIQHPVRFATIGIMALMSCGCQPVTVHEQNQLFLFLTLIFFSFIAGYVTAKRIYKGMVTEKQLQTIRVTLMQEALNDGKTFKQEIDGLKKENSDLKKKQAVWYKVFFCAGKG